MLHSKIARMYSIEYNVTQKNNVISSELHVVPYNLLERWINDLARAFKC